MSHMSMNDEIKNAFETTQVNNCINYICIYHIYVLFHGKVSLKQCLFHILLGNKTLEVRN